MSISAATIAGVQPTYIVTPPTGIVQTPTTSTGSDAELPTFQFIAGWMLLILVLYGISRTRVGYVAIYYSLLLMIIFIAVTEYAFFAPLLNSVQTIGQFNASQKG